MEKKFKLFLIIGLCFLLLEGAFTVFWMTSRDKTAYINTEDVYNSFDMKKKLEAELKGTQESRQHLLDSIKLQVDMMSMRYQQTGAKSDSSFLTTFSIVRDTYLRKEEEFKEANQTLAQQYSDQVWAQLNQYIKDYGHKEGYKYIFGASGDGALMFADDAVNISDDLKAYVNNRYKGQP